VRDPAQPVRLSGSALDGILACPLQWFLDREVHAETPRGTATAFGSIVHAVADFVAKDEVPADLDAMVAEVERIWPAVSFEAGWQSVAEKREARAALARFLAYHEQAERTLVATEASVRADLRVPTPTGGVETVALSGFIDRVERDADGALVAIDLKNMRSAVPADEVPEHGQLGVYQVILRETGLGEGPEPVAGAALVQLRLPAGKASPLPKVQAQAGIGEDRPSWVEERLGEAAAVIRAEEFPAIAGGHCRYCAFSLVCPTKPDGRPVAP
jgi:RecB family exonuclease